jgi:hypothetical protein
MIMEMTLVLIHVPIHMSEMPSPELVIFVLEDVKLVHKSEITVLLVMEDIF